MGREIAGRRPDHDPQNKPTSHHHQHDRDTDPEGGKHRIGKENRLKAKLDMIPDTHHRSPFGGSNKVSKGTS